MRWVAHIGTHCEQTPAASYFTLLKKTVGSKSVAPNRVQCATHKIRRRNLMIQTMSWANLRDNVFHSARRRVLVMVRTMAGFLTVKGKHNLALPKRVASTIQYHTKFGSRLDVACLTSLVGGIIDDQYRLPLARDGVLNEYCNRNYNWR